MKFLIILFFLAPVLLQAQAIPYTTLAPIDGYVGTTEIISENGAGFSNYLNNMFRMGVALCTALAVLMLIIGGIQYVSSDAWSKKSEGRERIFAALFGLLIALGSYALLRTINPALLGTELALRKLNISGITTDTGTPSVPPYVPGTTDSIKEEYTRVYNQWTNADDAALDDPNNPGYQAALDKWNNIQSQIDTLNTKHGPQVNPATANVGEANKKILDEINKGTCIRTQNCHASATALANKAGVAYGRAAYQSSEYVAGRRLGETIGTVREPLQGEMVDYRFYTKNADGSERNNGYPYHTVIIYSNNGNGNYTYWDWRRGSEGLITRDLNFTDPEKVGYVGRIYEPKLK
jgi:hypothetical protein